MTLEKHVMDTIKEWQTKIGTDDAGVGLYYPKKSLCAYLGLSEENPASDICQRVQQYFETQAPFLGAVQVTEQKERFCIFVGAEGCAYVQKEIPIPEFLKSFLEVIKTQDIEQVRKYFKEFANKHQTTVVEENDEDDFGIVFSFADKGVEPYLYCVSDDQFGITYHRFTSEDFHV